METITFSKATCATAWERTDAIRHAQGSERTIVIARFDCADRQ